MNKTFKSSINSGDNAFKPLEIIHSQIIKAVPSTTCKINFHIIIGIIMY